MTTTTNLSDFGFRELKMLEQILKAMREQGLPKDFYNDKVTPMLNMGSGYVFLTNEDCQVAMMNGHKLESFYPCPECGNEGFLEDVEQSDDKCCLEFLEEVRAA